MPNGVINDANYGTNKIVDKETHIRNISIILLKYLK